jgi:hypothetical protein
MSTTESSRASSTKQVVRISGCSFFAAASKYRGKQQIPRATGTLNLKETRRDGGSFHAVVTPKKTPLTPRRKSLTM